MKKVDGENILYHYIQKVLSKEEEDYAAPLIERLILDLSIWLPINLYKQLPILLPYVIRDPTCKSHSSKTEKEEWGSANENGFLRDDNTLIKDNVKIFRIQSRKIREYKKKQMGKGFTSSHIWRIITIDNDTLISNRHHDFNSFIPNVVWLPRQIAKLTDRDGSIAQLMVQAISHKIYRNIEMPDKIASLWRYLPCPEQYSDLQVKNNDLNFFIVEPGLLKRRRTKLINEINTITSQGQFYDPTIPKVKCSRYLPSLCTIPIEKRRKLNDHLNEYKQMIMKLNGSLVVD